MSETRTILPDTEMLKLLHVCASGQSITLAARTTSAEACCPVCGTLSRRVHSRYVRTLADLPWQGIPVSVRLHLRRFFCEEVSCERVIFTERLPGVVAHYARRTERLDGLFTHVSFALGGEAGARLLGELGVVVSGDTLLEHIRSVNLGEARTPRILSVDDFSFRRGRSWGTILVDLEHHTLVDILPDRSSETFARWLAQHAGVEVVSRDRSGEYADAVRKAAPGAIQVANRFHLIKNLGDVILRVFQRRSECLRSVPAPGPHHLQLTRLRLDREASRDHTRTQMRSLFRSIRALSKAGMNKSAIARTLGVHRHTVQKYSALESAPERKPRVRKASALAPYEDYILKRFTDGCHNATQIHKEIVEQGYPGAYNNVARVTQYLKKCEREGKHLPDSPPGLSAAQAKRVLITRPEKRTEQQRLTIERMKMADRHVGKCCHLFEEFARLFRDREKRVTGARNEEARMLLQQWMEEAKESETPELKAFAAKLFQDMDAVVAAMVMPYSQGQTEGRVNKLKLIKRSMYGRGNFDLLRQRVMYASAA
ncbi:MAG: ISL3 family transposase [Rubrobacteraceae bacterium]